MALTVKGTDANGRVTTGANVAVSAGRLIPPENAGVGDIVYCKSGADPQVYTNLKIIGWGTVANSNNITIGSDTYVCYGVIFGFVNGMARVVSLLDENGRETTLRWAISGSTENPAASGSSEPSVSRTTAITTGGRMRNGNVHAYAGMNLDSLLQNNYIGANTILHPLAAWDATAVMSRDNFNNLAVEASNAKGLYGTYENYVRQTMAIQGAPGTVFGFHDTGIKVHEQGRYNTLQLGGFGPGDGAYAASYPGTPDEGKWYPAANYCYNYSVPGVDESGKHNWWLPSMHELYDLMTDEHWRKVNTCGVTTLSNRAARWSCVRCDSAYAGGFDNHGFSYNYYFRSALASRPVTLLRLV